MLEVLCEVSRAVSCGQGPSGPGPGLCFPFYDDSLSVSVTSPLKEREQRRLQAAEWGGLGGAGQRGAQVSCLGGQKRLPHRSSECHPQTSQTLLPIGILGNPEKIPMSGAPVPVVAMKSTGVQPGHWDFFKLPR